MLQSIATSRPRSKQVSWVFRCFLWLLILLALPAAATAQDVTVSAAISLKEALTAVVAAYQHQNHQTIRLNFGASGILANQIEAGAPVDLFISAADKQVQQLQKQKLTEGKPVIVVRNRLVLIVPPNDQTVRSWDDLPNARRVSIGDPKVVPAGRYAAEALKYKGLLKKLTGKLVYGANVRQVLAYVERGEVDAGVVYSTDAQQAGRKVHVIAAAEKKSHDPIEYPAILIRNGHARRAGQFIGFLLSPPAQRILASFGFETTVAKYTPHARG